MRKFVLKITQPRLSLLDVTGLFLIARYATDNWILPLAFALWFYASYQIEAWYDRTAEKDSP